MKKIIPFLIVFFAFSFNAFSQLINPVEWTFKGERISADEAKFTATAHIEPNWHLYGQFFEEGGPMRLDFKFDKDKNFKLIGKPTESPKPKKVKDEIFGIEIQYFANKAIFTQRIKLLTEDAVIISGNLTGQACLEDGQCVMIESDFKVNIEKNKFTKKESPEEKKEPEKSEIKENTEQDNTKIEETATNINSPDSTVITENNNETTTNKQNLNEITETETKDKKKDKSLLFLFFGAMLAGLLAIFTPCVFPMIPMTVSFFMNDDKNPTKAKLEALFFGLSIIGIYTIIGTLVSVLFGANFANWLSTHWLPNILFFVIFMFFAASFLGMFEIVLPSSWVNKADKQVDKGGIMAPFFMAFTLVVVSFSCTGPLVGGILVESAGGAVLEPIIGMLGFSLAFAFPFTLFAFFPTLLDKMPQSGGWLNSVKVVLGFIELALGLKFLSVADQTYHWGLLDREVYIAFWIIIFTLMGLYLLGKIKFSHDSDLKYVSVPRLVLAIITFTFVVYLIPGMVGAPLKALSGYLPPQSTHDFDLHRIIRDYSANSKSGEKPSTICDIPKYHEKLHLPHGLQGYFDYEQGVKCAKELNKPIFIDFTGHGCVNCRKMEANVWADPRVLKRLRENFVIIALYIDDKTELNKEDQIKSKVDGKIKKTIGKKYSDFQIDKFKVNAQPYYVIMDTNGNSLVEPKSYDLNIDNFIKFLDTGLKNFNDKNK